MKVGVTAIVFDNITPHSYKVVMTLRGAGCRNNQGCWALPGGEVEDALRREIREEIGLEIRNIKLFKIQEELIDGEVWMNFVYLCNPYDKGVFPNNMEPHKFDQVIWLGFTAIDLEKEMVHEVVPFHISKPMVKISVSPLKKFKKGLDIPSPCSNIVELFPSFPIERIII